uniref:Uncharacterized protein n=1 Tax=Anguilla anguilla TaxID=7936 RepID=A0A0E9WR06_ANGAN
MPRGLFGQSLDHLLTQSPRGSNARHARGVSILYNSVFNIWRFKQSDVSLNEELETWNLSFQI